MLFLSGFGGAGGSGDGGSGGGSSSSSAGGGLFGLGGKKQEPAELAKEWKRKLAKEMRSIDRDINGIKRQEERAIKECKKLAKSNQIASARILAKEIVHTRKTVERMYTAKAQLNSVSCNLQTSVAMIKMQGCMQKSTEIMAAMNQ